MGSFYMEATQINYRRDETLKTVDQKLQELSETSAIDTDIAPVFSKTATYNPGDMVYYKNKLYVFNVEHTGAWAAADVTATDVTTTMNSGLNSLKSGLTNVDNATTLNTQDLTTASRTQNISPITLSVIKSNNTDGTWVDNAYTLNDVTFSVSTDSDGNVDGITVNGTASDIAVLTLYDLPSYFVVGSQYVLSGCFAGGSAETYKHDLLRSDAVLTTEYGSGITVTANSTYVNTNVRERIVIYSGATLENAVFLPMVRLANTRAAFAPYIPSVESRIEAVESNLLYLGKGTHDFKKTVYCGYISGSGNYVDFFVPCKYDNTISTVTLNSSALMSIYTFNGTLLTQGYIDFTVVSLEKTIGGLRIELKFSNTQTTYINTIVNIAFGNDSVFTFA